MSKINHFHFFAIEQNFTPRDYTKQEMEKTGIGQCTLCLKTSSNSLTKQLPCDHLFCAFCSIKIRQSKISCPKCRDAMPTPNDEEDLDGIYTEVREDFQLAGQAVNTPNAYAKTASSNAVNNNYPAYVNVPQKGSVTRNDKHTDEKQLFIRSCPSHGQETEFFCYSCETAACSKCLLTSHKIKSHEIVSLDDFIAEIVKAHFKRVDVVQKDLKEMTHRVNDAKEKCKKEQEKLEQLLKSKRDAFIAKVDMTFENLLKDLKRNGDVTFQSIAQLDSQRVKLLDCISTTQQICERAMNPSPDDEPKEKRLPVEEIIERINRLENDCKLLKGMAIPSDLNVEFQENPAANSPVVNLGMFVRNDGVGDLEYYDNLDVRMSQGWELKEETSVSNDEVDFVNIICMNEDWIVHVSNSYGSGTITIKHYSLSHKQECRRQFLVETGNRSWTIAKTAGHDRSILLAVEDTVKRISFRRKHNEYVQDIPVSICIEAITWDEYGVDCYILAANRRDVYWLSRDGVANYLCAIQTDVQSVVSISVNEELVITLLDRTAKVFYRRDCLTVNKNQKLKASPPIPGKLKDSNESLKPYLMASTRNPEYHFVLFNGGHIIAIGQFGPTFDFIDWVMSTEIQSSPSIIDMSVCKGRVYLLHEEKLVIYEVPKN